MAGDRQGTFDWAKLALQNMIADVPLPNVPGVKADTMRDVLDAIYRAPPKGEEGRPCWPGHERLAALANCSKGHLRRVLPILQHRLGLIVTYRAKPPESEGRKTMLHYVIVWSELATRINRAQQPCALDPDPCALDPDPCALDPAPHYMSARTKRNGERNGKELTTTTESSATRNVVTRPATATMLTEPSTRTDGAEAEEWVEVEVVLAAAGIGVRQQLLDQWRSEARDPCEQLTEVREAIAVATHPANRGRLRSIQAALVWRLRTGVWPADVVQDVDAAERRDHAQQARQQADRWDRAVQDAARSVRARTPRGQYVDEQEVIATAVAAGVPRDVAVRLRGVPP
jgi:hypothetical protein